MKPSKGADRASALALNPRNLDASIKRRVRLLAAFDELTADERADLLEAVETMAQTGTAGRDFIKAREIIKRIYVAAGWEL